MKLGTGAYVVKSGDLFVTFEQTRHGEREYKFVDSFLEEGAIYFDEGMARDIKRKVNGELFMFALVPVKVD